MSKRLPNLTSTPSKLQKRLSSIFVKPLRRVSADQLFWGGFALLTIATTFILQNPFWRNNGEIYREGDIVRESIISPADITYTDFDETEKVRETLRDSVKPIFTLESNRAELAVQNFRSSWESLQRHGDDESTSEKSNSNGRANSREDSKTETHWTGAGGAAVGSVLASRNFSSNELEAVTRTLRETSDGLIYNDSDREYFQSEVTLTDRQKPNQQSTQAMPESAWTPLSTAREKLKQRLSEIKSLSAKEVEAFTQALEPLIQPSVTYDSAATKNAVNAAAQTLQPVTVSLKRGQMIARDGDSVTPTVQAQIKAVKNYGATSRQWNKFFGLLLLIGSLYWIAWKFIEHRGQVLRLSLTSQTTFALFGLVIFIQVVLISISLRIAEFTAAQNPSPPFNDPTIWTLAVPFAFTSLLITLLADRRIALFSGVFASILAGILAPKTIEFTLYSIISSAVAVYGIGRYRSRQSVTTAGLLVGGANALTALALLGYTQQPIILNTVLLSICCGVVGGLITSAATAVFLPFCESAFGILTDVKLLELSNADLPILGQLALRAPGTNQHSHAVGQLAEEACRVVGANHLLTRIGALYHDIGKIAAPEHFVENQHGKNPHDRLKPVQSAKIIISHVTYGAKLAKEAGLPTRIVDFISQHHGTRTLHFFLRKAEAEAGEDETIEENEFRYPGPKPQFKESAIMMIADSCEAAARSLSQPTPENIRFITTKIIDAILSDDQLDECDLTLRELTLIRESMIRSLVAIYHARIDYPDYKPPVSFADQDLAEINDKGRGVKFLNPSDIPISKGGEIEEEALDRSDLPN